MSNLNVNKTGYVKCQICGEVFEAGQTACPVCGMGPEHFVPVEKEGTSYRNDTEREYVILGSGRAAVSAAEAIRERDAGGNITMISAERELPYTRPMLTKQMFAELGEKPFAFCEEAWFEEKRVRRVTGTITELNAAEKKVLLADGSVYPYDKCINNPWSVAIDGGYGRGCQWSYRDGYCRCGRYGSIYNPYPLHRASHLLLCINRP